MTIKRNYGFCAKCGAEKELDPNYVGSCCKRAGYYRPGLYAYCAVGGEHMVEDSRVEGSPLIVSRDYVCYDHLSKLVPLEA